MHAVLIIIKELKRLLHEGDEGEDVEGQAQGNANGAGPGPGRQG